MNNKKNKTVTIVVALAAILFIFASFLVAGSFFDITHPIEYIKFMLHNPLSIYLIFIAFFLIALDITIYFLKKENKEYEFIYHEYEQFKVVLGEINGAYFSFDIAKQKITVSEKFENIFGYTIPENWIFNLKERAAEHPEIDFDALVKAKSKVELTGKSAHTLIQALDKNQELLWLSIIMAPLYNKKGQIDSICGVIVDITDRYEQKHEMMMEQKRLTLAVNNLASLVISCNLTKNSFRMINYDSFHAKAAPYEGVFDELISIGASTVPEDDRQKFIDTFSRESLLAANMSGEKSVELIHKQIGDDGVVRWIHTGVLFVNNPFDDDVYEITIARDITEEKQNQDLIRKSFNYTLNNMPGFVVKWLFKDGDVILLEANQKYLEFMDTTAAEVVGKSIFSTAGENEKYQQEEKRELLEQFYACEKDKSPITVIYHSWKNNGDEFWVKAQASYFDEIDGCSTYYGTATEITEHINALGELADTVLELQKAYAKVTSVNAYQDLMSSSNFGGIVVRTLWNSDEHRFLYVSKGVLNTTGYTEEEYAESMKEGACKFIHPDDIQSVKEANMQLNELGDSRSLEFRMRHKEGHYLWATEYAMVSEMPNGEKVVASLAVDVSKQKNLEERLRISRQEYKLAAALSNSAVLSYDIKNRSYEVISNKYETRDFSRVGDNVPEKAIEVGAIAPESADLVRDICNAIERGEQRDSSVIALLTPAGNKYWMDLSYSIIFDDEDNPLNAILVLDDVTTKMHAESLFNISNTFLTYTKNAAKLLIINLDTNTIDYETEGQRGLITEIVNSKDASTVMRYAVENIIIPEEREHSKAFFCIEHFMEAYENDIVEETFEYRGYSIDNSIHWMNVQTRILQDSYTKETIVYAVFSDINEQKLAELELMRRAQTDSLTGLMNRESFEAAIKACCSDPKNEECGLFNAILMIDIDNFKDINDAYGHTVGDEALKQVAKRIRKNLRGDDIVARFGGDEFIVQLPRMPSMAMIDKKCAEICASLNFQLMEDVTVKGSVGVAVCPDDGCDFQTLFKKADRAMYQAKKAGGNRCGRFTEDGLHQIIPEKNVEATPNISNRVFARTFGYFDLFVDDKPLHFTNAKEKELLALLIDRNGGTLTADEAITYLWEDEPAGKKQNARYRKLAMNLKNTLQNAGIEDILVVNRGVRNIDVTKLKCDYYQFLNGDSEFKGLYHGVYMSNYSWSENTIAVLDEMI